MNSTCYRIAEDAHLAGMPAEAFCEPWKKGEGQYWVDIIPSEPQELEACLKNLNVSDLAIQFCMDPANISRVIPLYDAVFFEFPLYTASLEKLKKGVTHLEGSGQVGTVFPSHAAGFMMRRVPQLVAPTPPAGE